MAHASDLPTDVLVIAASNGAAPAKDDSIADLISRLHHLRIPQP